MLYDSLNLQTNADLFINNCSDKIKTIISTYEFLVNFKSENFVIQKYFRITVDKIESKETIQIRISERDHRKMYISTINIDNFNTIKSNQSLHVTFSGFVDNLVKIFEDCKQQNLKIGITDRKENQTVLEFYEVHSFKNLLHLSLPIEEAPMQIINFHLYRIVDNLQKETKSYENTVQGLKNELNLCYHEVSQVKKDNQKLKDDIAEQKQNFLRCRKEELNEMQEKIRKLTESKEIDVVQYKNVTEQFKSKINSIMLEKANAVKEKANEIKKNENLRRENSFIKANSSSLKQTNEQLEKEIITLKNIETKNRSQQQSLNKKLSEQEMKIKKQEKQNYELNVELEAERKICQTKRNALTMATEEISKANEIIAKKSTELLKLKTTIEWRTEVALQQELALASKEKQILDTNKQLLDLREEVRTLRIKSMNVPSEIKSIQQSVESIENKYKQKIAKLEASLKIK